MEHPSIVKIHDVIIPQGDTQLFNTAIIIMEAVQSDLKTLFRAPAFLDDDQIVYIFYQIVCGLKYMHSANILHRDLKPANVLINSDCSVKIADLGLARSYSLLNKEY
jgi:mitogen-activated protein kinase 1/3